VPDSVFSHQKRKKTDPVVIKLRHQYPGVFWYHGGTIVSPTIPEQFGNMESTLKTVDRMNQVQGNSSSSTAILSGMKDFSGLTDEFGKRICYQISATMSLWLLKRSVDIKLYSIGDMAILASSLNKWKREIALGQHAMFPLEGQYSCDFKFLLPSEKDLENCHLWKDYISQSGPRDGSALVLYLNAGLPTSPTKGVKVDYNERSSYILPFSAQGKEIVAWCTIFGSFPFMHDTFVKKEERGNINPGARFHKHLFCYSFSAASSFRGILSTIPSLELVGFGFPKVGKVRDMRAELLHTFPLSHFGTQAEWYQKVVSDACSQMVLWLAPISRYSPISNLPFMSKNAATITRSTLVQEEGELISNMTFVANRQVKGDVVNYWKESDDEDSEEKEVKDNGKGEIFKPDDSSDEYVDDDSSTEQQEEEEEEDRTTSSRYSRTDEVTSVRTDEKAGKKKQNSSSSKKEPAVKANDPEIRKKLLAAARRAVPEGYQRLDPSEVTSRFQGGEAKVEIDMNNI